jgi:hypothetical protein
MTKRTMVIIWIGLFLIFPSMIFAMDTPSITATAKGPNQINLTWSQPANPGWGYVVEIQSASDSRYSSYTQLSITRDGRTYLPYWVTEANYIDPQDGSACQFPVFNLLNNTLYNFKVRCYGKTDAGVDAYGSYSTVASATTSNYTERWCTQAGAGAGNGTSLANAWSLATTNSTADDGMIVYLSGTFTSALNPANSGSSGVGNKIVFINIPGGTATFSNNSIQSITIVAGRSHIVLDGIKVSTSYTGTERVSIGGNHLAIVECEVDGKSTGSTNNDYGFDIGIYGVSDNVADYNLVHRCYIHNVGNVSGEGEGYPFWVWPGSNYNVIQYNHLSNGGHDTLYIDGASYNRILNNFHDGWGMGLELATGPGVPGPAPTYNLVEGNVWYNTGYLNSGNPKKPDSECAGDYNTYRRNVGYDGNWDSLEIFGDNNGYGAKNNLFYNNVFYNNPSTGITSGNGNGTGVTNNTIANNIIYGCATEEYPNEIFYQPGATYTGTIIHHNVLLHKTAGVDNPTYASSIYFNNITNTLSYFQSTPPYDAIFYSNLTTTPSFVDQTNGIFHLKSTSGLIGAGSPITGDYWGDINETDIGAFKYYAIEGNGSTYNESVGLSSKGNYSQHLRGAGMGVTGITVTGGQ